MGHLVIVGAGPIGTAAARAAVEDGVVAGISCVVDPAPEARDHLRALTDAAGYPSTADLPEAEAGDRAVVAFSSSADKVAPEIIRLVSSGYHVVTTCEELAWPDRHLWDAMHTSASSDGRVIIVAGANPGFVMDRLPLVLATAARNVTTIRATRRVDTSTRRQPLVAKTGKGLTPDAFAAGVEAGELGHKGLVASARLLAHSLGWPYHDAAETIDPILVDGLVTGVHHRVRLRADGVKIIELDLAMAWKLDAPGDVIEIAGDPPIRVELPGGYHGDAGTIAQVVSALARCTTLSPGFYRPTDLPLRLT